MKCDKVYFKTLELAENRANNLNKPDKNKLGLTSLRAYKCNNCDGFHLTKVSKDAKEREDKLKELIHYWRDKHNAIKKEIERRENDALTEPLGNSRRTQRLKISCLKKFLISKGLYEEYNLVEKDLISIITNKENGN